MGECVGRLNSAFTRLFSFIGSKIEFLTFFVSTIRCYFKDLFSFSIDYDLSEFSEENEDFIEKSRKFLDKYSVLDLTKIINQTNLPSRLAQLGIDDWYVEFDLNDPITHYLYVRTPLCKEDEKFIAFMAASLNKKDGKYDLFNVRWFALQNPLGSFTNKRPRLPGQKYPGTGFGRECVRLTYYLARKSGRDGILNSPEHFHNAYMYDFCYFVDPQQEGWFRRLKKDLRDDIKTKGLAMVSWAIYLGYLREKGSPVKWEMKEQAMPISLRYYAVFFFPKYNYIMEKAKYDSGPFTIDWKAAEEQCLDKILLDKTENE